MREDEVEEVLPQGIHHRQESAHHWGRHRHNRNLRFLKRRERVRTIAILPGALLNQIVGGLERPPASNHPQGKENYLRIPILPRQGLPAGPLQRALHEGHGYGPDDHLERGAEPSPQLLPIFK